MKSSRVVASRWLVSPTIVLCTALAACQDDTTAPRPVPEPAVAVTYCAAAAPTWVAFRDGDGTWTRALPDAGTSRPTFSHVFTSNRAAIASLTTIIDGQITLLRVFYGTPAELATEGDTTAGSCTVGSGKTLRGNVSGLATPQSASISVGPFARTAVQPVQGLDFTVEGVPSGPQDLLAARNARPAPVRLLLRRNIDLPDGSVIPTLDFESSEAFDVVSPNVTIGNLGAEPAVNLTELITAHGNFILPFVSSTTSTTQPYIALPPDRLLSGDLHRLHVSVAGDAPRTAEVYFRSPVDRTVTMGAPMVRPSISVIANGGTPQLRARFVAQSDYDKLTTVVYDPPARPAIVAVTMTSTYAALTGGYDLDVPDLSAVTGFEPSWTLRPGETINWTAVRSGGTVPIGRNAVPVEGATRRTSVLQDTMTLP